MEACLPDVYIFTIYKYLHCIYKIYKLLNKSYLANTRFASGFLGFLGFPGRTTPVLSPPCKPRPPHTQLCPPARALQVRGPASQPHRPAPSIRPANSPSRSVLGPNACTLEARAVMGGGQGKRPPGPGRRETGFQVLRMWGRWAGGRSRALKSPHSGVGGWVGAERPEKGQMSLLK